MEDEGILYGNFVYFTSIWYSYFMAIWYSYKIKAILVYFIPIWYIFPSLGLLYQEKSGNPVSGNS
jgi:hypothetical protein